MSTEAKDEFADGERVGDYILGRILGQGSFGRVKIATHVKTEQTVAIKIVEKGGMTDVEDVERMYREVLILTNLKHRNIIRLFEVFEAGNAIFLAMEFAGGGELHTYWEEKGVLTEKETCHIFHQIIAGVESCHRVKVIHRDLKLENILLDENGIIKIADFGLSNSIKFGQKLGTHCGTPSYTSPEQISSKKYVGAAADIWSLGVILYALLCGFLPFEAENIPQLFKKIVNGCYSFPSYISKEAQDLVTKMMTVDVSKRCTLAEIRNHPWFLMQYSTELMEYLDKQPVITKDERDIAHTECLLSSDTQLKEIEREKRIQREKEHSSSNKHHHRNSFSSNNLDYVTSGRNSRNESRPRQRNGSLINTRTSHHARSRSAHPEHFSKISSSSLLSSSSTTTTTGGDPIRTRQKSASISSSSSLRNSDSKRSASTRVKRHSVIQTYNPSLPSYIDNEIDDEDLFSTFQERARSRSNSPSHHHQRSVSRNSISKPRRSGRPSFMQPTSSSSHRQSKPSND